MGADLDAHNQYLKPNNEIQHIVAAAPNADFKRYGPKIMNPRQFVNSVICLSIEKAKRIHRYGDAFIVMLFPNFLKILPRQLIALRKPGKFSLAVYIFVFIFLFVTQGLWAYLNGQFFPDNDITTKKFIEDWENLLNYSIICEAYCILGLLCIRNIYLLDHDLKNSSLTDALGLSIYSKTKGGGYLGSVIVLFIALFGGVGYANEIKTYKAFYWFMQTGPGNVTIASLGHYYIFVNFLLLLLVTWVAFAHLGFFRICGTISSKLREIAEDSELRKNWLDEHQIKKWLHPISRQILTTKLFVLSIVANLVLWKVNEPNADLMLKISVSLLLLYGIWIVSIPRYYIQFRIFNIWKKHNIHEYKDLSMPWILGASATVDLVLITFLVRTLTGAEMSKIMELIS